MSARWFVQVDQGVVVRRSHRPGRTGWFRVESGGPPTLRTPVTDLGEGRASCSGVRGPVTLVRHLRGSWRTP